MLAGILFEICLAPVHAVAAQPAIVLPIVIAWVLGLRFARRFAVPIAMLVTAAITIFVTRLAPGALAHTWPDLVVTAPSWNWSAAASLTIPLFIVTMASQNLPGLTVLRSQGYKPDVQKLFTITGLLSIAGAVGGGGLMGIAAITGALTAGPEAHPDPNRRFVSTTVAGVVYILLGLASPLAAALIVAAPTMAIKAVAGLALMTSFAGALATSLQKPDERVAVIATFVVSASGISFLGVGASFWGLLVGGVLLFSETWRRNRAA
jgi:benzoate membrane transport protein